MDLSGIISISGKPGLYRVVAKGKNSIIVESLTDNKRFPAYASDRISALEDISIYTYDEDKPLKEIFEGLYTKVGGGEVASHKEDIAVLQEALGDVLPNYDEERVYPSDIKKIFQWYNLLHKSGLLDAEPAAAEEAVEENPVEEAPKKEKAPKKKAEGEKAKKAPAAKSEKPAKKESKS
jgi:hypothetical protein